MMTLAIGIMVLLCRIGSCVSNTTTNKELSFLDSVIATGASIADEVFLVQKIASSVSGSLSKISGKADIMIRTMELSVNLTMNEFPKIKHNICKSLSEVIDTVVAAVAMCVLVLLMTCCCSCCTLITCYKDLSTVKDIDVVNCKASDLELLNGRVTQTGAPPPAEQTEQFV